MSKPTTFTHEYSTVNFEVYSTPLPSGKEFILWLPKLIAWSKPVTFQVYTQKRSKRSKRSSIADVRSTGSPCRCECQTSKKTKRARVATGRKR